MSRNQLLQTSWGGGGKDCGAIQSPPVASRSKDDFSIGKSLAFGICTLQIFGQNGKFSYLQFFHSFEE